MLLHLPGFLDIALLALAACWLRLRCQTIRPGILLHMTYNTGPLLAGPLVHWFKAPFGRRAGFR